MMDKNKNKDESKDVLWMFCPLVGDRVKVALVCAKCDYWTGERCLYPSPKRARKLHLSKYRVKRPRMRKGGRGLRIPPVWEKWPDPQNPENITGEIPDIPEGPDYDVAGLLAGDEDFGPEPWEKKVSASEEGETFPSEPEIEVKSDAGGLPQLPEPAPTPKLPSVEPPVNPLPGVPLASPGKIVPLTEEPGSPDLNEPPGLPDQPRGEGIGKA